MKFQELFIKAFIDLIEKINKMKNTLFTNLFTIGVTCRLFTRNSNFF